METSNYSKMKLFQIISIKVLRIKLLALQLSSVTILEAQEYLNLQLLKVLIKKHGDDIQCLTHTVTQPRTTNRASGDK